MSTSFYSPLFNVIKMGFDYRGALDNWAVYADTISLAVNLPEGEPDDGTYEAVRSYAAERRYPVIITQTAFAYSDPFMYGKIVNAALQGCPPSDLYVEQDLDERWRADRGKMSLLTEVLRCNPTIKAFFVPTIDLYGSYDRAAKIGRKWYCHGSGLYRGAVQFGIKPDGRPCYEKTSTDELIDEHGNLVPTASLLDDLSIESLRVYVANGMPVSYHLGFFDLVNRSQRAQWWSSFWTAATNGDPNNHITDVAELEKRHTFEHDLPLWPTKGLDTPPTSVPSLGFPHE